MVSTSPILNQFTNAFDNAAKELNTDANLVVGENGSLCYESAANSELDFEGILCEYFLLMRNSTKGEISEILNRLINIVESKLISKEKRKEFLIKILKLSLFIRNPRSGKGEKQIFYHIIDHLYSSGEAYKKMCFKMLDLLSEFGYYKDYNNIYVQTNHQEIKDYILNIYFNQLSKDINEPINTNLSLCGRWAPRENSKYHNLAIQLANKLFNTNTKYNLKQYRQNLSKLNKKLCTVQTYMCQKHWADIEFKNVPSIAMTNLTKAFQDEKVNKNQKSERNVQILNHARTRRHRIVKKVLDTRRHHKGDVDYEDREKCRLNLFEHIKNGGKINASVSDLSQIIKKYMSGEELDVTWEAQFNSRVEEIQKMISELSIKPSIFPMVDLSSSMSGSPMINAITLGLFTSMIMDNPLDKDEFCFANRFLSFSTEPNLVKLPRFSTLDNTKPATLKEKIEIMKEWTGSGKWGGSTNIHKAIDLLLSISTENKVPQSDMPKILAIFSDMQFDQGDSSWNKTSYENICDKFKNAGYEVPHVLFWNLRANTEGFQVKADTPNSSMLSGYSTRMLDLFLSADLEKLQDEFVQATNETNENEEMYTRKTPTNLMNKALEHKMFEKYLEEFNNLF
jgi:hypothetical protein